MFSFFLRGVCSLLGSSLIVILFSALNPDVLGLANGNPARVNSKGQITSAMRSLRRRLLTVTEASPEAQAEKTN